ncbi:MAG: histidine triad nucleotide-binding protein [Marmoricola sp.]
MSDDCLFCKIIRREIPAEIVAESEHALAFRDIMPVAPTHVLVIPKLHEPNAVALAQADPAAMGHLFQLVETVVRDAGLDNGYRAVFNTGADALQTVFHAHLHVLGGRGFDWPPG